MTSILGRIFPDRGGAPAPTRGDQAYAEAMNESDDLRKRLQEAGNSAAGTIVTDVWAHRRNMPFLTTVHEAVQEAKSGPESAD